MTWWRRRGEDDNEAGTGDGMLVLGDDVPDVEDTTPEELRRRAEEAEREIAERKRQAEAEIEANREEAERALRSKQSGLDRKARELERKERQLARQRDRHRNHGSRRPRPGDPPPRPRTPLHRTPFHRNWAAGVLAAGAAAAIGATGLAAGGHTDHSGLQDLRSSQYAFVEWRRAALQLDEDVSRHLAGQEVEIDVADGQPFSVGLFKRAVELTPTTPRYYAEDAQEGMSVALADGVNPIRTLSTWSDLRSTTGYGHSEYRVKDSRTVLTEGSQRPLVLTMVALLCLVLLLALALTTGSFVGAGLAVVAGLLALAVLGAAPDGDAVDAADAGHQAELDHVADLTDEVEQKLQAAFGLSTAYWLEEPEDWVWDSETGVADGPEMRALAAAQQELGTAALEGTDQDVYPLAVTYVQAAQAVQELQFPHLETARLGVDRALTRHRGDVNMVFLGTVGGVATAVAAYGVGAFRSSRAERKKT